jgi:hypothetical protein
MADRGIAGLNLPARPLANPNPNPNPNPKSLTNPNPP